jgi:hypothetical protein
MGDNQRLKIKQEVGTGLPSLRLLAGLSESCYPAQPVSHDFGLSARTIRVAWRGVPR